MARAHLRLGVKDVPGRLAKALLVARGSASRWRQVQKVPHDLTQEEMANLVGLA